jgi:aldose 1-epimerase
VIELVAGTASCTLAPELGGRVASLRIDGRELLVGGDADTPPMQWGSYPMAPWAGRIRHGRFTFDGVEHQLPLGMPPHAIHGTTYLSTWDVVDSSGTACELRCELGWELGGVATQRFELTDGHLRCELAVTAGDRAMPAEIGWHPWFVRPTEVRFSPLAMYERDAEQVATHRLVPVAAGPWDDCFVNVRPVELRHPDLAVTLTSDCVDWVVYDEPAHAVCVEPQSGPPDAFTTRPRRLGPGVTVRRWFDVGWRR